MTSSDIASLLARVREAVHGDRDLDADIYEAAGFETIRRPMHRHAMSWRKRRPGESYWTAMERPSTSLDSIVALIERELPGPMRASGSMEEGPFCRLLWAHDDGSYGGNFVSAAGATEALACCVTFLTALQQRAWARSTKLSEAGK